jgi:hypothetical protein
MIQQNSCRPILRAQYIEITRTYTRIHTNPLADSYVCTVIKHMFFCKMLRQRCLVCSKCSDNTKTLLLVERLSAICPIWLQGFRLITNEFVCLLFFRLTLCSSQLTGGEQLQKYKMITSFRAFLLSDRDLKFWTSINTLVKAHLRCCGSWN